jgi:hypothetical protein
MAKVEITMVDVTEDLGWCLNDEQRETLSRLLHEAGCFSDQSGTVGRFEQCYAEYREGWQRLLDRLEQMNLKPMTVGKDGEAQPFTGDQAEATQVTADFFAYVIASSEQGHQLLAKFIADALEVWRQATTKNMALVPSVEGYFEDWASAYRQSHALCLLLHAIKLEIPSPEINQLIQITHDGGDKAAVERAAFLLLESAETTL